MPENTKLADNIKRLEAELEQEKRANSEMREAFKYSLLGHFENLCNAIEHVSYVHNNPKSVQAGFGLGETVAFWKEQLPKARIELSKCQQALSSTSGQSYIPREVGEKMYETFHWLNIQGGLGFDKHKRIEEALQLGQYHGLGKDPQ